MKKDTRHKEVILAFLEGREVQLKTTEGWIDLKYPDFSEHYEYRIKPEPQLIPFDFSDDEMLIGMAVRSNDGSIVTIITSVSTFGIEINGIYFSYGHLLDKYTFLNGEPCGKEVQS